VRWSWKLLGAKPKCCVCLLGGQIAIVLGVTLHWEQPEHMIDLMRSSVNLFSFSTLQAFWPRLSVLMMENMEDSELQGFLDKAHALEKRVGNDKRQPDDTPLGTTPAEKYSWQDC
jgi:hypothetical protein